MLPFLITNYKLSKRKVKDHKTKKMTTKFLKLHNNNSIHHNEHKTCWRMSHEEARKKEEGEKVNSSDD